MAQHAITVRIDMDGNVTSIKDKDEKDVPNGGPTSNIIKTVDHKVIISKGSTCVTYQTPQGSKTV